MGFERHELRHRTLLARFMTGFSNWASRGDNYDALSDLSVCVFVRVNKTESIHNLSIFSVGGSHFPYFPYNCYGSMNQDTSRPVRRPVTAAQAIHVSVMRTLVQLIIIIIIIIQICHQFMER
jgi:hypothetical protein